MALARGPTRADTRSRISAAALLVKVIASTWPGCTAARGEQVGDALGQHSGLARPGAGDDEERAALVEHGLALLGVQAGEQLLGVGRPAAPAGPPSGPRPAAAASAQVGTPGGVDQGRVGARVGRRVDVRVGPRFADVEAVEEGAHVGSTLRGGTDLRGAAPGGGRAATWGGRGHHRGPGRRASSGATRTRGRRRGCRRRRGGRRAAAGRGSGPARRRCRRPRATVTPTDTAVAIEMPPSCDGLERVDALQGGDARRLALPVGGLGGRGQEHAGSGGGGEGEGGGDGAATGHGMSSCAGPRPLPAAMSWVDRNQRAESLSILHVRCRSVGCAAPPPGWPRARPRHGRRTAYGVCHGLAQG